MKQLRIILGITGQLESVIGLNPDNRRIEFVKAYPGHWSTLGITRGLPVAQCCLLPLVCITSHQHLGC